MKLFELTKIPLLSGAMDAYALRHKAIASNIANVGTPGYRPKSVRFEEELAEAARGVKGGMMTTNARHIGGAPSEGIPVAPSITEIPGRIERAGDSLESGINGVDLDQEMTELAKNQIRYKFSARILAETFRGLQKSIRGTL